MPENRATTAHRGSFAVLWPGEQPAAGVLVLVLAAVLTLVVDLDRPRNGFLQVSQQPLIDLMDQLGPP